MANPITVERLRKFSLFEVFADDELAEITRFVEEKEFFSKQELFKQGTKPDYFYLVEKGSVEQVGRDDAGNVILKRRAQAGDWVGHRPLLKGGARHQATATVAADSRLLAIGEATLKALLSASPEFRERLTRIVVVNRLLATPLCSCFSEEQLFRVADLARIVEYTPGQIIFQQGEPAESLYVIDTGQVKVEGQDTPPGGGTWPQFLSAGCFFGEDGLSSGGLRRTTVQAVSAVTLFRFSAEAVGWLQQLQPEFKGALIRPNVAGILGQVSLFKDLTHEELRALSGYVGLAHYPAGEEVYSQGEYDPTLYILYRGEAVIRHRDEDGRMRPSGYLRPGNPIGEASLFLEDPRDNTVEPVVDSDWLYLTRSDLDQFLARHRQVETKLGFREEVEARRSFQRFPWMDDDESFVLRDRRHWFFLVARLVPPAVVLVLALFIFLSPLPNVLVFVSLALGLLWMAWRVVDWTNDYFIVTNKRVAHREKVLLLHETRLETPLDMIQNMNIRQNFWGDKLNFGWLEIDTAAAAGVTRVTFDYVAKPDEVQRSIYQQISRLQAGERSSSRRIIRDKLEASVGTSVQPVVPRPAVPLVEGEPKRQPGLHRRPSLADVTWRRWFWIEKREGSRITWRKHWIRFLAKAGTSLLAFLFLVALLLFLALTGDGQQWGIVLLLSLLLLPIGGWFWWNAVDWGNDQYIVTDEGVIDTEALPLGFRSRRTETTFDRIQNVNFDIPNVWATILDYGTVFVFTAGAEGKLDFEYVSNPKAVHAEIFRRLSAYKASQRREQREQRWEDLPEWFAEYDRRTRP